MRTPSLTGITPEKLKLANYAAAAVSAAQAIALLILVKPGHGLRPLTMNFLAEDNLATAVQNSPVLVQGSAQLLTLRVVYAVAASLLAAALLHVLMATRFKRHYEADLTRGGRGNRLRWLSYAVSGSLIVMVIAMLSGITDVGSLILVLVASMGACAAAYAVEAPAGRRRLLAALAVGLALTPWVVIAAYAWGSHIYANGVPQYLYWIYAASAVAGALLAALTYYRLKRRGAMADAYSAEAAYTLTSIAALSVIAWLVFAGALRR